MMYAKIIFIRRDGTDGTYYPLTSRTCLFGRHQECDIPIKLREVADNHCQINVNEDGEILLTNLTGNSSSVSLNGSPVSNTVPLRHGDVFCIRERSFRFEVQSPLQKNMSAVSGAISQINSSGGSHHSEGTHQSEGTPRPLVMENTEHRNIEPQGNSVNVIDGNNVETGSSSTILPRLNSSGFQMFHLQRIGPPATKPGVADVMDFWKVTSLIGRKATQIDFLIDSSDYVQGAYVSRLHARMVRRQKNIHRLFDDSLNGVFVNNFKIAGHVDLQVGDRVTFGHPQGSKLTAGTRVHQPDSEYQFMFEICSCPPDSMPPHHQEHNSKPLLQENNVARVPSSFRVPSEVCVPKSKMAKRCRNATRTFTQEDIATCQSQNAGTSMKVEMNEDISDQKHNSMFEYADKMQTEPVKKDDSLEMGHDVGRNEVQHTGFSCSRTEVDTVHSSVERMAVGEVEHNRISFQAILGHQQEEAGLETGPSGSGLGSNEKQQAVHTGSVTCVATMKGNSVRVIDRETVPNRAVLNEKITGIGKQEEFIAEDLSEPGLEARICGGQLADNTGSRIEVNDSDVDMEAVDGEEVVQNECPRDHQNLCEDDMEEDQAENLSDFNDISIEKHQDTLISSEQFEPEQSADVLDNSVNVEQIFKCTGKSLSEKEKKESSSTMVDLSMPEPDLDEEFNEIVMKVKTELLAVCSQADGTNDAELVGGDETNSAQDKIYFVDGQAENIQSISFNPNVNSNGSMGIMSAGDSGAINTEAVDRTEDPGLGHKVDLSMMMDMEVSDPVSQSTEDRHPSSVNSLDNKNYGKEEVFETGSVLIVEKMSVKDSRQLYVDENGKGSSLNSVGYQPIKSDEQGQLIQETGSQELDNATIQQNAESVDIKEKVDGLMNIVLKSVENVELKNMTVEKSDMASGDEGTNGITVSHNYDIVDNSHLIKDIASIQQQSVSGIAAEMYQNVAIHEKESNMEISDPGEQLNQVVVTAKGSDNNGEVVEEDFIFGEKEFAKEVSYSEGIKGQEVASSKMDFSTDASEVEDDIDKTIACFEEDFAKEASNTGQHDDGITMSDRSLPEILVGEKATDQGDTSCKLNVLSHLEDKSTSVLSDSRMETELAVSLSQKESFEDISNSREDNFNDIASFEDPSSEVMSNPEEKMEPGHVSIGNNELKFLSNLDEKSTTVLSDQGMERNHTVFLCEKDFFEDISNPKGDKLKHVVLFEEESSEVMSNPEEKMEPGHVSIENNELEVLSNLDEKSTTVLSDQGIERNHTVSLCEEESFEDISTAEGDMLKNITSFERESSEVISNTEEKMEQGLVSMENNELEVLSDTRQKSDTVLSDPGKERDHAVTSFEKESFQDISNPEEDNFRDVALFEEESSEVMSNPEEKMEPVHLFIENNELAVLSDLDKKSDTVLSVQGKERDMEISSFEKESCEDISDPEEDSFIPVASFEKESSEVISDPEEKMGQGLVSMENNELEVLSDTRQKSDTVLSDPGKERDHSLTSFEKESFQDISNPEEDNFKDVALVEEESSEVMSNPEEKMEPEHLSIENDEFEVLSDTRQKSITVLSDSGKERDHAVTLFERKSFQDISNPEEDNFSNVASFEEKFSESVLNPEVKMKHGNVSMENNKLEFLSDLDEKSTTVLSDQEKESNHTLSLCEKESFEDISKAEGVRFKDTVVLENESLEVISNPKEKMEPGHMSIENNELEVLSDLDEKSTTVLSVLGKERDQGIPLFQKESFEIITIPVEDNFRDVASFEDSSSEVISNPEEKMDPGHVSMENNELEVLSDLDKKSDTVLSVQGKERDNAVTSFEKKSFQDILNPEEDNFSDIASFEEKSLESVSNPEEKMKHRHVSVENNELEFLSDLDEKCTTVLSVQGKERDQGIPSFEKESFEGISNPEEDSLKPVASFEKESSEVISNSEEKMEPGHMSIENNEFEVLLDLDEKSATVLSDPGKERDHAVTLFEKESFQDISNPEEENFRKAASFEEKSSGILSNPEEKMEQSYVSVEKNELEFLSDLDEKSAKEESSDAGLLNDKSSDAGKKCSSSLSYDKTDEIYNAVSQDEARKSQSVSQLETKHQMEISEDDHSFLDQSNTGDVRESTFQQGCSQDLFENSSQWNVSRIGCTDMTYGIASADLKSIENVESVGKSSKKRKLTEIFQENYAADDDNGHVPTGVPLKKRLLPTENEHSGKSCSKDEVIKDESVVHMDWYEMESLLEHKTIDTKVCVENDTGDSSGCATSSIQNTDSGKQQFLPENDREIENNHIRKYFPGEDQSTLPIDCGGKTSGFKDNDAHNNGATCIVDTVDDSGSSMNLTSKTNSNEQQCLSENRLETDEELAYGSRISSKEMSDTEDHERAQDFTCNDGDCNVEPPTEVFKILSSTGEFQIIDMKGLSSREFKADSVAVMSDEDAESSELASVKCVKLSEHVRDKNAESSELADVKGVKVSELVMDKDAQSSEPASDRDAESSELYCGKGARSSALVGDEDVESSELVSDKDAESLELDCVKGVRSSGLVEDEDVESSELVSDKDAESSELVSDENVKSELVLDNDVESLELVMDKDAESSELVMDKDAELSELVMDKDAESSELVSDKDAESSVLVMDKDAESSEHVMDKDAELSEHVMDEDTESSELVMDKDDELSEHMDKDTESSELVSDKDAESSELVMDKDAESSELIIDKTAESSEHVSDNDAESSECVSNKNAESSELVKNKDAESSELAMDKDDEPSELVMDKDAESSELVSDKDVILSVLVMDKTAESSEHVSDNDAESSERVSNKNAESSELVKNKDAESSELAKDTYSESSELVMDKDAESSELVMDKDTESSEHVSDNDAESSECVSNKNAESSELKNKDAESSELVMDKNVDSSELVSDKDAESSELLHDKDDKLSEIVINNDAKLSELVMDKDAESSEYGSDNDIESLELVIDNNAGSPELVMDKDVESSELVSDKDAESSELVMDKDAEPSELVSDKDAILSVLVMDKDAESLELVRDKDVECSELVCDKDSALSEHFSGKNSFLSECGNSVSVENDLYLNDSCIKDNPESLYYLQDEETTSIIKPCDQSEGSNQRSDDLHTESAMRPGLHTANEKACKKRGCGEEITIDLDELPPVQPENKDKQGEIMQLTDKSTVLNVKKMWQLSEKGKKSETKTIEFAPNIEGHGEELKPSSSPESEPLISLGSDDWDANSDVAMDTTENDTDSTLNDSTLKCLPFISTQVHNENVISVDQVKETSRCFVWSSNHLDDFSQQHAMSPVIPQQTSIFPKASTADQDELLFSDHSDDDDNGISSLKISALVDEIQETPIVDEAGSLLEKTHSFSSNVVSSPLELKKEAISKSPRSDDTDHFNLDFSDIADDVIDYNDDIDERPVFDRYRDVKEDNVSNVNQSDEENVEDEDYVNENEEEHSSGNYGGNIEHVNVEDNENVDENFHGVISNDDNTDDVEEEEGHAVMLSRTKRKLKNNDNEYMSSPKKVRWSFIGSVDSPTEGKKLDRECQRHDSSTSFESHDQSKNSSYSDQSDLALLSLDPARSPSKYTSVRRQLEYKVKEKSRFQTIKEKLIHLTKDIKEESNTSSPMASSSSSQETLGEMTPNSSQHNQFPPEGDHEKVTTLVTRCKSILEKFRQILNHQMDVLQTNRKQALIEELGTIEKWSELPKIVIAVVGNTGDGKSSLMNAMLGHSSILPTSGIRACTAVVVEVVQNSGSLYEGCIEFLTKEEWYSELERLIKDLTLSDGNLRKNPPDPGSEQYVSYCKVKAVYGKIDKFDVLAGINKVTSHLGQKQNVKCKQAKKFRLEVERYIETQEPQSGGQFWPIVKRVQLRLPNCDVCRTGAVLVDLPGVRDSNAARDKIARDYLKTCSAIWVVSAIHRAIDDKTAQELLTENFRRQLLMDGQYGSVAFICTKSDQFENSEIIRTLKLQNKCKDHEQKISIMEKKKQRLLEEIKICRKRTHNLNAEIRTSLKECEDLQSLIQDIETQQMDSDKEQSVDYEPMEEAKVMVKEKEKEREKNEEAIQEITEYIDDYERQIQELETQIRQRRRKISHICASARNDYCREKIKQKFQSGLKEIKRQAKRLPGVDEDDDDDDNDDDEDAEEMNRMVNSLKVFCCSSTEYQKMKELIPADGEPTVFNSPEETEIPSLQEYVHELTRIRHEQYLERLIKGLGRCIFNFQSYLLDGGTECVETRNGVKSVIEKYLQDLNSMIQPVLQKMAEDLESTFNDMIQPKFHEGVGQAAQEATGICQKWGSKQSTDPANRRAGGLHWATYKATIQRLGVYSSSTFGNIDLNEELSEPFYRTITLLWSRVFSSVLWRILETVQADILEKIQHFNRNVSSKLQKMGFPANRINHMKEQVESSVNYKLTEMVLHLKPLVTAKQRDISRILSPHVQSRLVEIYSATASHTGIGSFQRMKQEMESGIDARRMYIFDDGSQKMMHELLNLKTELVNTVTAVCDMLLEDIKLSFEPLWEDPSQSVLLRDTFQQHMEEVCEEMRAIYRDTSLQNTEEHVHSHKKPVTTQHPPTQKRPQERKNVIEIVNRFISPVPEELTKMTQLEVLKVEKGSHMYPVKDVKQKPGLSSDSGMHNPSDVASSSGMDVTRIKMEVLSDNTAFLHHYKVGPPDPPSLTAVSSEDSVNHTFTSMAGPSNVYDFGEASVTKNSQHDQTRTKIKVRAKQTHNSKSHKNVPPEVRIALENHMVKRSTENSSKHGHAIVPTIDKQRIENSSIAATAQQEAGNSSRGSGRGMVSLLKPKPGTSATDKLKQLAVMSLSDSRQLSPAVRMTSSTMGTSSSVQARNPLIQTKGTTSGGTEGNSCDIKGTPSSDLKRTAPSVKTFTTASGINTTLSDKMGTSLPITEDDDSLPEISIAKRRKKTDKERNNSLYENVQENPTCTYGAGKIPKKISTDTSLSTSSVSSRPRLLSNCETEATAISKTQNSKVTGSSKGPQRNKLRVEHSSDSSSSSEMLQITKQEPQEVDHLPHKQQSRHKQSPVIIDLTLSDDE